MGTLSSAIGNTFQALPQQSQQVVASQSQGGQTQGSMGATPDGLQNVNEVTDAFYQKWQDLETFAQNMKSYGIDVTKANFGSAEGREAHSIYQKALADLNYQGNKLKGAQKMLETAFKSKTSAHGDRVDMGLQEGQVYDPNQFNISEDTRQMDAAKLRADTQKSEGRLNRASRARIAGTKAKGNAMNLAPYEEAMQKIVKGYQGAVEWKIDKTSEGNNVQTSDWLQGFGYGGASDRRVIKGLERDANGTQIVFERNKDGVIKKLDFNRENLEDIFTAYIQGNKGTAKGINMADALRFLKGLGDEDIDIETAFAPDVDAQGFLEQADVALGEANVVKDIKDAVSKKEDGVPILNEALVGLSYKGKTIKDITQNKWKSGDMEAEFEDGSKVSFGSGAIDTDEFIDEVLKSNKESKQAGGFEIGGVSYSMDDLLKMNYTEDQINQAIQSGKITVK